MGHLSVNIKVKCCLDYIIVTIHTGLSQQQIIQYFLQIQLNTCAIPLVVNNPPPMHDNYTSTYCEPNPNINMNKETNNENNKFKDSNTNNITMDKTKTIMRQQHC